MDQNIKLTLTVDANKSINSLGSLEQKLNILKEQVKNVNVGSKEFKSLQQEIIKTDSQVKNLNKSMEGLDTEAMAGEFGKFAGGITAGFTAIAAVGGESMEEVVKTVSQGMAVMQGIEGATEAWKSSQKLLNGVLSMNPIGLIITAIGTLIGIIAVVITKGDGIKNMLDGWAQKFSFLKGPIDVIKKGIDLLMDSWKKLSEAVSWALQSDEDSQKNIDKMRAEYKKRQEDRDRAEKDRLYEKKKAENQHTKDLKDQLDKRNSDIKASQDKQYNDYVENKESEIKYLNAHGIDTKDKQLELINWKIDKEKEGTARWMELMAERANMLNEWNQEELDGIDKKNNIKEKKSKEQKEKQDEEDKLKKEEADKKRQEEEDLEQELWDIKQEQDALRGESEEQYLQDELLRTDSKLRAMEKLYGADVKYNSDYIKLQQQRVTTELKLDKIISESKEENWNKVSGLLGQAASLFEENTFAYKALASAQIIIDTAMGAMKAFNSMLSIPIVGTALGAVAAGVVIASGAVQLAKVNGISFADGGVLVGPSHAQGGILTPFGEVEGGEGIINTRSMSNPSLRNMASIANVAGGGRDFSNGDGSIKLSSESIMMITQGINDKKVYVTESDITSTQNKVKMYETNSTI